MRRKWYEVDDITDTRGASACERLQSSGLEPWARETEPRRRAHERKDGCKNSNARTTTRDDNTRREYLTKYKCE